MQIISIVLTALGLSADCFAVTLAASITNRSISRLQWVRVAFAFGFFQALMPVLGWLAGRTVINLISNYDHWVAFGLLAFVGGRMLWESLRHRHEEKSVDISRGWPLITLSIATSIDALAVGLAFAFENANIALASPIIGVVCFAVSATGFRIGKKVGEIFGRRAEIIGGLILIGIGVQILIEHLVG
jgi:putative Mn2+ efflux pump MntP